MTQKEQEEEIPDTFINAQLSENKEELRLILKSHNLVSIFHMTIPDAEGVIAGLVETLAEIEKTEEKSD